jgi:hypothetical protein
VMWTLGITTHKTNTVIFTAMRTSNLRFRTYPNLFSFVSQFTR